MAEEKSNALSSHVETKHVWQLLAIIIVTTIVWNLPTSAFGIDGLTIVQQRIIAIFVFATLSWLTECIPAWATSLSCVSPFRRILSEYSKVMELGNYSTRRRLWHPLLIQLLCSSLQVLSWRLPLLSRDLTRSWHATLSNLSVTRVRMFFWASYLSQDSSQCSSRTLPQLP